MPPLFRHGSPPPPVTPAQVAVPPNPQNLIPLAVVTVPPTVVHCCSKVEQLVQVPGTIGTAVGVMLHAP